MLLLHISHDNYICIFVLYYRKLHNKISCQIFIYGILIYIVMNLDLKKLLDEQVIDYGLFNTLPDGLDGGGALGHNSRLSSIITT